MTFKESRDRMLPDKFFLVSYGLAWLVYSLPNLTYKGRKRGGRPEAIDFFKKRPQQSQFQISTVVEQPTYDAILAYNPSSVTEQGMVYPPKEKDQWQLFNKIDAINEIENLIGAVIFYKRRIC
eukprot:6375318-Prymnesium_polylepis.2